MIEIDLDKINEIYDDASGHYENVHSAHDAGILAVYQYAQKQAYSFDDEEADILHIALAHSMEEKPNFWETMGEKPKELLKRLQSIVYGEPSELDEDSL